MSPRQLQSKIHSDFSTGQAVWETFRSEVSYLYNATTNRVDFNNHLIREYNRKINNLGLSSDLYFAPYDAGFRYISVDISINYFRPDGASQYLRSDGTSLYLRP